ncbi:MAG: bifunctional adenosylcobinamide kinase/adenosylcobinamide-phosphate guanylyltransferase [Mycobacteriales bacterium]
MQELQGRVLVIGGARSGKSAYAESLVGGQSPVTYVATAPPQLDDPEWAARVAAHKLRRPTAWATVETTDLVSVLAHPARGSAPLLIDSVTAWLAAAMDQAGSWTGDSTAEDRLRDATDALVAAWSTGSGPVVAVTDEVGQGVVPDTVSGRLFRDELGQLNQRLATSAYAVWFVTAGMPQRLK